MSRQGPRGPKTTLNHEETAPDREHQRSARGKIDEAGACGTSTGKIARIRSRRGGVGVGDGHGRDGSAVMVAGLPATVVLTDTSPEEPFPGSVTVHTVPTGRSS